MPTTPTLVITRPKARAERFAEMCRALIGRDIPILIAPVVEIIPMTLDVDLTRYRGLIVTSEAGLASLHWPEQLARPPVWAVGPHTAELARTAGFDAIDGGGDANALVDTITGARPNRPLLHLRCAESRGRVQQRLEDAGFQVDSAIAYRQEDVEPDGSAIKVLQGAEPAILPIFSPRSAERLLKFEPNPAHRVVAMSSSVEKAWPYSLHPVIVAKSSTAISMAEAVAALYEGG